MSISPKRSDASEDLADRAPQKRFEVNEPIRKMKLEVDPEDPTALIVGLLNEFKSHSGDSDTQPRHILAKIESGEIKGIFTINQGAEDTYSCTFKPTNVVSSPAGVTGTGDSVRWIVTSSGAEQQTRKASTYNFEQVAEALNKNGIVTTIEFP